MNSRRVAALAVLVDVDGDVKILLGRRARTLEDGGLWSVPAGEVGRSETPLETAVREFEEETGIKASAVGLSRPVLVATADEDVEFSLFAARAEKLFTPRPARGRRWENEAFCWETLEDVQCLPDIVPGLLRMVPLISGHPGLEVSKLNGSEKSGCSEPDLASTNHHFRNTIMATDIAGENSGLGGHHSFEQSSQGRHLINREDPALMSAREHAFHALEFMEIGKTQEKDPESLAAGRKALVRLFADYPDEVLDRVVDRLQERGALPSGIELGQFSTEPAPVERREEVADQILKPLTEGCVLTRELLVRLEDQATEAMVGFARERMTLVNEMLAQRPVAVEDDRLRQAVAGSRGPFLLVDTRDGVPTAKDLEAMMMAARGGDIKALSLLTADGEASDTAAGYRMVLETRTCRYYPLTADGIEKMDPSKRDALAASIRNGRTEVAGRGADPRSEVLGLVESFSKAAHLNKETVVAPNRTEKQDLR